MIRFSVVKLGDKLGGARNQRGKIEEVPTGGDPDWARGQKKTVQNLESHVPISDLD